MSVKTAPSYYMATRSTPYPTEGHDLSSSYGRHPNFPLGEVRTSQPVEERFAFVTSAKAGVQKWL